MSYQSIPVNATTMPVDKHNEPAGDSILVARIVNPASARGIFVWVVGKTGPDFVVLNSALGSKKYWPNCLFVVAQCLYYYSCSTGLTVMKYIDLDLQVLVDLLVIHSKEYDRIVSSPILRVEEFTQCKQQLAEIHAAIKEKSREEGIRMEFILPNFPGAASKVHS